MNAMQKLKQAKLYQYNSGEYKRLDILREKYLRETSALSMFEEYDHLDLSNQSANLMPPLNTISFYFVKIKSLSLN
jgi:hypothetical protein